MIVSYRVEYLQKLGLVFQRWIWRNWARSEDSDGGCSSEELVDWFEGLARFLGRGS